MRICTVCCGYGGIYRWSHARPRSAALSRCQVCLGRGLAPTERDLAEVERVWVEAITDHGGEG